VKARNRLTPEQLASDAAAARHALKAFLELLDEESLDKHGLNLDAADKCVIEVEWFVRAYHELYGSPVR
jgi:hypothetical protein